MKATVLDESSFIFPLGSLRYADVYRHESGRCCTLPFFLTFFYHFTLPGFQFIWMKSTEDNTMDSPTQPLILSPSRTPLLPSGPCTLGLMHTQQQDVCVLLIDKGLSEIEMSSYLFLQCRNHSGILKHYMIFYTL